MTEQVLNTAGSFLDVDEGIGYDPLDFIEGEDDWEDDDAHLLPNVLPPDNVAPKRSAAVYSPERAGSVRQALRDLVTVNASRRTILLSIVDAARDGISAQELFSKIEELQKDNLSVYAPISYCRMLERAGALKLELSESDSESSACSLAQDSSREITSNKDVSHDVSCLGGEEPDGGEAPLEKVTYLTIEEKHIDPLWRSTEEGLAAYDELVRGDEWRQKILDEDERYAEVYLAVMLKLQEGGCKKGEIVSLAESFPVTRQPLKWGNYFIDVLEATSAIHWSDASWRLTDLGKRLLPELQEFCAQREGNVSSSS